MRKTLIAALSFFWTISVFATTDTMPVPPNDCQAGIVAARAENCSVAIDHLSRCLTRQMPEPVRSFVLQARAQCYSVLNQPAFALQDQKASLEIETPKNVWPLVMLGAYYRELKQYDLSLAALKEALKYDEDGPGTGPGMAVYYHTGQTLHAAGRYAEAVEAYTVGIPRQPDYGYALYRRALSYEALGDKVQTKRDLFRAAELEPQQGYEPEIKAKLTEYGISVPKGSR